MSDHVIALEDIRVSLGGYEALRGVSAAFATGRSTVVVGPSGCGKSTMLNGIAGFVPFSGGLATIAGRPIGRPDRNRGI
ncbi:MAG TPA: ATP-binding cassette domain-containing protein, partial [Spirochaetia bacterium]